MSSGINIRPIGGDIIVEQDEQKETTTSGLYMPQGVRERWSDVGTVRAVGPGVYVNGVRIPLEVKEGDRVVFKRRPSSALNGDGLEGGREEWKNLLRLQEEDIIGVIEDETRS